MNITLILYHMIMGAVCLKTNKQSMFSKGTPYIIALVRTIKIEDTVEIQE